MFMECCLKIMHKKVYVYLTKIQGVTVIFAIFAMMAILVEVKVLQDYGGGGGVWKGPKKDYVICEQPLSPLNIWPGLHEVYLGQYIQYQLLVWTDYFLTQTFRKAGWTYNSHMRVIISAPVPAYVCLRYSWEDSVK